MVFGCHEMLPKRCVMRRATRSRTKPQRKSSKTSSSTCSTMRVNPDRNLSIHLQHHNRKSFCRSIRSATPATKTTTSPKMNFPSDALGCCCRAPGGQARGTGLPSRGPAAAPQQVGRRTVPPNCTSSEKEWTALAQAAPAAVINSLDLVPAGAA